MNAVIVDLSNFPLASLCELNNAHALETSFLTEERFSELIAMSFYARGFSGPAALLLAMDQSSPYVNINFQFFQRRHDRFVYIDRLITADYARRQALARRLYEDLFELSRAAGHRVAGCEVNLDPPNPGSDAFHEQLGFKEVGRATLSGGKTVRYLERSLL
jgi:predicted GNAT superfamily acetyltransferase